MDFLRARAGCLMKIKEGDQVRIKGLKKRGIARRVESGHPLFDNVIYVEIEPGGVSWCVPAEKVERVKE